MEERTTKPGKGNKYYIRKSSGGYSPCITGKPTDKDCDVLSNCVGYAVGRFNEEINAGSCKYLKSCNAENFIRYNPDLENGKDPKQGAVMCWEGKGSLAGHVCIVERVIDKDTVFTSESAYGGKAFYNKTRKRGSNGNWNANSDKYSFNGFLYNPEIVDPEPPTPTPTYKYKIGDKVIINGRLYGTANGDNPGKTVKDKITNITRIAEGKPYPYNTTGDLGWMSEDSISPYEEPSTDFKVGDRVAPITLVDYYGKHLKQYDAFYYITELVRDRAVLSALRDGRYYVWAAMNTNNIKKV